MSSSTSSCTRTPGTPTPGSALRTLESNAGPWSHIRGPAATLLDMLIDASADWRSDLGAGTTVALIQAGTFTSDAGTILGPVPRLMWERLVEDEINPDHSAIDRIALRIAVEMRHERVFAIDAPERDGRGTDLAAWAAAHDQTDVLHSDIVERYNRWFERERISQLAPTQKPSSGRCAACSYNLPRARFFIASPRPHWATASTEHAKGRSPPGPNARYHRWLASSRPSTGVRISITWRD